MRMRIRYRVNAVFQAGYLEGIEAGKQQGLEEGFHHGFVRGIQHTIHWAVLQGKIRFNTASTMYASSVLIMLFMSLHYLVRYIQCIAGTLLQVCKGRSSLHPNWHSAQ